MIKDNRRDHWRRQERRHFSPRRNEAAADEHQRWLDLENKRYDIALSALQVLQTPANFPYGPARPSSPPRPSSSRPPRPDTHWPQRETPYSRPRSPHRRHHHNNRPRSPERQRRRSPRPRSPRRPHRHSPPRHEEPRRRRPRRRRHGGTQPAYTPPANRRNRGHNGVSPLLRNDDPPGNPPASPPRERPALPPPSTPGGRSIYSIETVDPRDFDEEELLRATPPRAEEPQEPPQRELEPHPPLAPQADAEAIDVDP